MNSIEASQLIPGLDVSYPKLFGKWNLINAYRTRGDVTLAFNIQCVISFLIMVPIIVCDPMSLAATDAVMAQAIHVALNSVTGTQAIVRQASFRFWLKEQSALFELLRADLLSSIPRHKRIRADDIYTSIAKRCNLFCYMVIVFTYATDFAFACNPQVRYANATDDTSGSLTILGGWYPIPFLESPWAEAIFVYELLLLFCTGASFSLYGVIFTQQIMSLRAHQAVLSYHLSTLTKEDVIFHSGKKEVSESEADELLYREMLAIIRDHQKLLRYGELLNKSYSAYIAVHISLGVVSLIINFFQLIFQGKAALLSSKFILYFSLEVTEFVLFCFNATTLQTTSTDIHFSSYNTDWYTSDKKLRTAVSMIMVRSQKPVSIVAFNTYPINVTTLISIFQFTYSVATLLLNVNE